MAGDPEEPPAKVLPARMPAYNEHKYTYFFCNYKIDAKFIPEYRPRNQ